MVMTRVFRSLSEEVKEAKSIIRRIRLTADSSALGANFRAYGATFNVYDFSDFVERAREFYHDGFSSADPNYSVVEMPNNRVAIDYRGEIRGIFTRKGKPLAFFRPDFRQSGYVSKAAELADFRKGRNILFS